MNILLVGYGAMGKRIHSVIDASSHQLTGIITSQDIPQRMTFSTAKMTDVIIDFSHPENLPHTLTFAVENSIPLVMATTGLAPYHLELLKSASVNIPILLTTNTSYGVAALVKLLSIATPLFKDWDIEIIEMHHNKKIDSPSGTAKTLLETIEKSSGFAHEKIFGRGGLMKRSSMEIGIHSIRGGTIVGNHSVLFCGQNEVVELKHSALSKDIFAQGALKISELLLSKPNGLYSMQDLIKI